MLKKFYDHFETSTLVIVLLLFCCHRHGISITKLTSNYRLQLASFCMSATKLQHY